MKKIQNINLEENNKNLDKPLEDFNKLFNWQAELEDEELTEETNDTFDSSTDDFINENLNHAQGEEEEMYSEHKNFLEKSTTNKNECNAQTNIVNNINFNLCCEIGQILMRLEEVLNLKSGDILNIADLPPKVKLSINGSYIAEGVLVDINGRLGVKLLSKNSNI